MDLSIPDSASGFLHQHAADITPSRRDQDLNLHPVADHQLHLQIVAVSRCGTTAGRSAGWASSSPSCSSRAFQTKSWDFVTAPAITPSIQMRLILESRP
ncbi:hypothetical protein ACLKA7_000037 [Drosophila subpalustris]